MDGPVISRRSLVLTLPAMLVSGCGDTRYDGVTRMTSVLVGDSGIAYDPVQARQLPYATMDAKIGISQSSLIVLSRYDGPDLWWASADRIILTTRNGRLMATSGFPKDLLHMVLWDDDPITEFKPATGTSRRGVDLAYRNLYGIYIESRWTDLGEEVVDIHGETRTLRKCVEACVARDMEWEFENVFWRDENNVVWQSIQHFSPTTPPIQLAVLKQPAEA